jgi:hypothetical protein
MAERGERFEGRAMGEAPHGSATTTEVVARAGHAEGGGQGDRRPRGGVLGQLAFGRSRPCSVSAAGRKVRQTRFGFSWRLAVLLRNLPIMPIGFSWISLDSLVRIETFQWVTGDFRWKNFSRALRSR